MLPRQITSPLFAGALALAIALPGLAFAGAGHQLREACRQDVATLCPDADSPCDAKQCLREHSDQLSSGCTQAVSEMKAQRDAVRAACAADVGHLCPDADSRQDARKCLRANRDQLSTGCTDALHAFKQARHGDPNG
jgi:Cysteine rich repeat